MLFDQGDVPVEAMEVYTELLDAPLMDLEDLIERVMSYRDRLAGDLAEAAEFVDEELAQTLVARSLAMLERIAAEYDEEAHRIGQAAALYFLAEEESEEDLGSAVGFDDDREIFNAVALELGFSDLVIGY